MGNFMKKRSCMHFEEGSYLDMSDLIRPKCKCRAFSKCNSDFLQSYPLLSVGEKEEKCEKDSFFHPRKTLVFEHSGLFFNPGNGKN